MKSNQVHTRRGETFHIKLKLFYKKVGATTFLLFFHSEDGCSKSQCMQETIKYPRLDTKTTKNKLNVISVMQFYVIESCDC